MSNESALLAAIWEHPHEDTPRLVYADWLQENDQPERAEFIRVQCALAQFDRWDDSPQKAELERREEQLWKRHAKAWKAHLPKLLHAAPFRCGFPAPRRRATIGSKFVKMTAADFEGAPLWDFRINSAEKHLARVFASALMTRVETLEIPVGEIKRPELLADAAFKNLATLHIGANWIGGAGVAALAANPALGHLRDLDLGGNELTDATFGALVAAPWFPGLRALNLGGNRFGEEGLRTLIWAETGALRTLGLRGMSAGDDGKRFGDAALAELCRSPRLAGLRELDLGINYIGPSGARVLASAETAFRLRALHLDNSNLDDTAAESLAAWPGLATVETLILSSNPIGPRGGRALARSPHLGRVRALWLMHTPLVTGPAADRGPLVDRFGDAVWFDYRYR